MQASPSMYKPFLQISQASCAGYPLPQNKPYRGQALQLKALGRNEWSLKLLRVGKEVLLPSMASDWTDVFAPSWAESSAESSAAQGLYPSCPGYSCLSTTGAAGSGLAWGSTFRFWFNYLLFWLLQKNGSIFLKGATFREKSWCAGEFKWGMVYLILFSPHSSWALYPN